MTQQDNEYNKIMITRLVRRALHDCFFENVNDYHDVLLLLTLALDRLLLVIYECFLDDGLVNQLPEAPDRPKRCGIVLDVFASLNIHLDCVNEESLSVLMPIQNRLKHSLRPRVKSWREAFGGAQLAIQSLFMYQYGEYIPLDDDECSPTLSDLSDDEFDKLKLERIRFYIAPYLSPEELQLFDLMPEHFSAGVVDSATLRRATSFPHWFAIGKAAEVEFLDRLLRATADEAELLFCQKALQIVAELRAFVRTEAWSVRATSGIAEDNPRSDAALSPPIDR